MKPPPPLDLPQIDRQPRETVNQWVYRRLRLAVMIGRIPPGRPLTIRDLALALEVSTMPVREALRRLASERALEVRDNRRIEVPVMTALKFRELCEARIALECHAAERALPFITADRLALLAGLDAQIDAAQAAGDRDALTLHNQAFHRALYETNPHQVVLPLIESVWLQLGPFTRLALARLDEFYHVDRHSEALAALRSGNPLALRVAIEADIRDGILQVGTTELLNAYIAAGATLGTETAFGR
ncbi:GntR family transcriptional regulator [Rhodospirillum rubrum]|uniref:Transcriptional regulator, GntR family n=1 Tax=Rhodospirillum rubrum (strain ATCC 11170 / ATH 1.1.1 / DSM 467 / LMG 4362 / NCIMB 8255 / S1) TaxID=269796 RepID=Q2RUY9_RHORT|nr:GntR family transcriptional regulator [Rhodospirillum rubrum]ABC22056.1 transcriptional regulator, GntR family [Rhodospirillum rubrum ATCC 11170]AEO47768.1 GntR family transcriptional regulator [Rhodospirillum rubrum F11]MBK5953639.1 GntR family transcriptional regulator [Rhodospirillum rubrum]QXG81709.1 GntR family transcriptional regulator [Rhodospirillum rubrum]HAP99633.1 GntR family transcriptional regulator [Rhodospirillum rubrum]